MTNRHPAEDRPAPWRALFSRLFVWGGGGAFVASLALCGYTYAVRWSSGRPGGGWAAAGIDASLVAAFAAHHSLFARNRAKQLLARAVPEALVRSVYVWAAAALLALVCLAWRPVGGELYDVRGWAAAAALAVQLAGLALIARSTATIDPLELAGIRQFSAARRPGGGAAPAAPVEASPPHRLQVTGPYRLVRHPLYLGWTLVVLGTAHLTGDRLVFAGLTTAYLAIAIPWEERSLAAEFGAEYERYRSTVRWRLLPYVY